MWGMIFGCCQLLLLDQRPGVFIRLIDCWVWSEFSEVNAVCVFTVCGVFRFNAESSEMRGVGW